LFVVLVVLMSLMPVSIGGEQDGIELAIFVERGHEHEAMDNLVTKEQ